MPKVSVRPPTGEPIEVDAPEGATRQDIIRLAKEQRQRTTAPPPEAVTPAARPDIVGRAKEWLTREPPLGARTLMGETDLPGRVVRSVGDLFLPGSKSEAAAFAATLPIGGGLVTGPLKRMAASTVAGAGTEALQRGQLSPSDAIRFAGSQGIAEILPAWLRFGLTQRAGQPIVRKAEEAALREAATYKERIADFRKSEAAKIRESRAQYQERTAATKRAREEQDATIQRTQHNVEQERTRQFTAETERAKAAHAQATREYSESGAKMIADSYKEHVPSFREFASTEAGLVDMVYGRGPARVSAMYDAVMQEVARQGRGVMVEIPLADAHTLKLRGYDVLDRGKGREVASVEADRLAAAVVGKWKDYPGVYRRAASAVDAVNLDPAWAPARAEYKAAQALIQFTDKSQMLKGRRFNPDAAEAGFTMLKKVDELRRRGMGSAVEGPIAAATQRPRPELRLPAEPTPISAESTFMASKLPVRPMEAFRRPPAGAPPTPPSGRVLPPGVTTRKLPQMSFWEGAALAELPFLIEAMATGRTSHLYLPWAVGGLLAHGVSGRELVTRAPLSPASQFSLRVLPPAMAQEARKTVLPPPVPLEITNTYRP